MYTAEQQQRRGKVKSEFARMINMSVEEMQTHFASPDSDMASLNPRLSPHSGKALGKRALPLKAKEAWDDADFDEAESILRPLRFQLSRKVPYAKTDGTPTLFCTALRNRGHDPLKGGAAVIAEGAEISLGRKLDRVRQAVQDAVSVMLPPVAQPDGRLDTPYVWVNSENIFETYAVVEWESEKIMFAVPYAWDGDGVIVDPSGITEVEHAFVPVQQVAFGDVPEGVVTEVAEAAAGESLKWVGVMIRAGKAKNRSKHNGQPREYPAEALKAAVAEGVFDGVPAYDRTDKEHLDETGWEKLGTWGKAAWSDMLQAVVNTFTWEKNYPKAFDKKIRTALAEGRTDDLPACSITGDVTVTKATPNIIEKIQEVRSCDWISFASAGGTLLAIQESDETPTHTRTAMKLITATKALAEKGLIVPAKLAPAYDSIQLQVAEGAAADFMLAQYKEKNPKLFEKMPDLEAKLIKDEPMLVALFETWMAAEGVTPAAATEEPTPVAEAKSAAPSAEDLALRDETRRAAVDGMLAASGLSDAAQNMVRTQFHGRAFDRVAIQEAVRQAKDFEAAVRGGNTGTRIDVTTDGVDKIRQLVNDFYFQDIRGVGERTRVSEAIGADRVISKRESAITPQMLYRALTGDSNLSFDSAKVRVSEAMDTTLAAAILVEGMNTRLLYSFNLNPDYQTWQRVVRIVTKQNFKTNEAIVSGGFTGYATKNKGSAYATITETGATKETYAILERGGIFSISYPDIINDDIDYMAGLPARLGDYAARMLSAFMWNLVTSNPTLATDSKAVFHTDHGNLLTDALASGSLETAIGYLIAQAYPNSTDKMGLVAKTLVTSQSVAQRKTAYELTENAYGATNAVATFLQRLGITPTVNPHTADVTDWYVFADPAVVPIIEAGFFNGRIEPEIQSSMIQGVGDWWTKRDAQFRIAHDYNAAWVSYQGAVAAVVAN